MNVNPRRRADLSVEWLHTEAVVYCHQSQRAFWLNPGCARLLELCDGTRDEGRLFHELGGEDGPTCLEALRSQGLLEDGHLMPRRDWLTAAAAALVMVVGAPLPALAASSACITNVDCSSGGFGCNPCDIANGAPPDCTRTPPTFCMQQYQVRKMPDGTPIGSSCVGDTPRAVPRNCEPEQASGIWHRNCNIARQAVVDLWLAQPTPRPDNVSDYKCCFCS